MAVKIFFSYAHEDKKLRDKLAEHLSLLNWEGLTTSWYDGDIRGGMEWEDEINQQLKTADIILLLISRAFMASKFCYSNEMEKAMARHEAKEACVIPIILRPVLWKGAKFSKLQALPSNGKAVTSWANQDEAFLDIAEGIQGVVEKLSKNIEINSQFNGRQAPSPPLDDRINLFKTQEFDDEIIDSVKEELDRLLKADQSQMLTMDTKKQLFLALRKLFNRKTFFERVEDCLDQNWGGRLRAASLTKRVLRDYQKYIPQFGAPVYRLYEQLIKEVDEYCMGLMGVFKPDHLLDDIEKYVYDVKEFKNHLPDRLLKPDIPTESIERCDMHLKRINELVEQLTADYV